MLEYTLACLLQFLERTYMKLAVILNVVAQLVVFHTQGTDETMNSIRSITGEVERFNDFRSEFVDSRNVDVWLPPGYDQEDSTRYPVIYMHDGQNLFDPALSFIGVDWGIDETMTRLIGENRIRKAIVVGIWNTPKRYPEYMPQMPVEAVADGEPFKIVGIGGELYSNQIVSDNYLRFLVKELKPFVDEKFRTLPGRANTFIMGSSMGGLISAYAMSEYPDVFGAAACISTHWPAGDGIVIEYMKHHMPDPRTHRFYFDHGTETTDAAYEPYQMRMDIVMKNAGYEEGVNWITRKHAGDEHSERAWSKRVHLPLIFLLCHLNR